MARQPQQPFPKLQGPFVNPNRSIAIPWYRLLISLWQRTGGGGTETAVSVYLQENVNGGVDAYNALTNVFIGEVLVTNVPGAPVQPVAVGPSPFVYRAPSAGTLVVFSGKVEISRDGIAYYLASLTGGPIPLQLQDYARVTWFNAVPPTMEFFPNA